MSELTSAVLKIDAKGAKEIPVQFNPSSLSLQMQNSTDGARSKGRQKQQYNGSASVTLSVDLEFDSTDVASSQSDTGAADVRRLTEPIRDFMIPRKKKGSKAAPPRICFTWGTIEVRGTMQSLKEDLTYFSKGGVPLQSKLSIQIKGQDPEFDANQVGPGANPRQHAPPSGGPPIGANVPPGLDPPPPDSTATALAGETPAEFMDRAGLPPEAWRAVADSLDDDFELPPGTPVDFPSDLVMPGGTLLNVGVDARLAIEAGDVLAGRTGSGLGAGIALSSVGGVAAGAASVLRQRAAQDSARARDDFAIAAIPSSTSATGPPAPRAGNTADAADVDLRAATFGAGVPLREKVRVPSERSGTRFPRLEELQPSTRTSSEASCGCHHCDPWSIRRRAR